MRGSGVQEGSRSNGLHLGVQIQTLQGLSSGCPPVFPFLPSFDCFCFTVPFDENDLEEDEDSEPAEIEGEAAENGDTGDTGAELDDGMGTPRASPSTVVTTLLPAGDRQECLDSGKLKTIHIKQKQGTQGRQLVGLLVRSLFCH